jgi:transposase-like protein
MSRNSNLLKSGIDYPKNWEQFIDWFHDDQACLDYIYKIRWPNGFICPRCCLNKTPYKLKNGTLMCTACRKETSVTAGTIFNKTRTSLKDWFGAVWYITNQKNGVSALGVHRLLGLGSYQTSWSLLHKLRSAMVNPEREKLSGLVEVDETFIGGVVPRKNTKNHSNKSKTVVLVAIELLEPKGFGRVRLRHVSAATKENISQFILDVVKPGSVIYSDGSPAYNCAKENGFDHQRTVHLGSDIAAHITMPGVHRVASLLKRWLLGAYQGAIQEKQLEYYLDEYTFRFNRRKSKSRGLLFYRLLEQAVATAPLTYDDIRSR